MERPRNWVCVINNYSPEETQYFKDFCSIKAKYAVCGLENGTKNGTPHMQCYIALKNGTTKRALSRHFPRAWLEKAEGTPEQNREYCTKDNDFFEIGEIPKGSGSRSDLNEVKEIILKGGGMKDVVETTSSFQALRYAETLVKYLEKRRDFEPEIFWFYGSTGTGKSESARFLCDSEPWTSSKDGRWFDGYDAHECIILDDFRGDFCKFHELLKMTDRYEYRIEFKGGSRQLLAKKMFFTCPWSPEQTYQGQISEQLDQLLRRIKHIWYFHTDGFIEVKKGTMDPYEGGQVPNIHAFEKCMKASNDKVTINSCTTIGAENNCELSNDKATKDCCTVAQRLGGNNEPLTFLTPVKEFRRELSKDEEREFFSKTLESYLQCSECYERLEKGEEMIKCWCNK